MRAKSVLRSSWEVPEEFRQRLGEQAGRQRAMSAEGHLLLVFHEPPSPEDTERRGRFFWRGPDGNWTSERAGDGLRALQGHVAEYEGLIHSLERREENASSAADYFSVLRLLGPLRRAAGNMRQTLQQARQMVSGDRDIIVLRDDAEEIETTAELVYADARNGLDLAVALQAEEQARISLQMSTSAHRLNVLVAFFFPLATMATVFGMNLQFGLEQTLAPLPFVMVLAGGLVMGLWLRLLIGRPGPMPGE